MTEKRAEKNELYIYRPRKQLTCTSTHTSRSVYSRRHIKIKKKIRIVVHLLKQTSVMCVEMQVFKQDRMENVCTTRKHEQLNTVRSVSTCYFN